MKKLNVGELLAKSPELSDSERERIRKEAEESFRQILKSVEESMRRMEMEVGRS
ncbi:MAG TPA: hypothetical protein VJB62_02935 [Patescibacteria group bacterium]|nr:MAG: hypothetical protein UX07_C0020G0002 [Parcubacteria group bacterium GW2011_GWA2_45_30]HLD34795.1 hypothetical protein [Patescibacteria group bacterium]